MKNLLSIALFLSVYCSTQVFGQRTIAELEMKAGKAQNVFSSNDALGNFVYIFQGTKSFQITVLDPSYKVTKEFLIDKDEVEKKNTVVGATLGEGKIVVYLYNDKGKAFSSLVVDRVNGNYKFNPSIGTLGKDEFLLKSFEMGGVFYATVIPEYKNTVLLFSSNEGENFVVKRYEIDFQALYARLSAKNDEINQKTDNPVGIEKISYTVENNIKSSYPSKKMYTYGNKIYMTFEEPSHTHLIIIDPQNPVAIYRKLNFSLDQGKDKAPRQGNSFLYKGDLFRVTFNNDQLNLIVINLDSMEMLKSYNVLPDQNISFMNGAIKEDGNDIQDRIVKTTNAYFRKVQRGKLAIAVNDLNNGQYATEIGGYDEYTTTRGSGYPMTPGLSIGGGIGLGVGIGIGMGSGGFGGFGGYPGYYPYGGYGGGYTTTSIHVTYFESLLRVDDLSHIPGVIPKTIREKVNDYEDDVLKNNSPELLNFMSSQNGLLLGYYVKGRSKYILVEFKR